MSMEKNCRRETGYALVTGHRVNSNPPCSHYSSMTQGGRVDKKFIGYDRKR